MGQDAGPKRILAFFAMASPPISLTNLQIFVVAATYGSMTAAANELSLSKAAVSIAIKRLERELGIKLFKGRKAAAGLTPDGEELFLRAAPAMANLYTAIDYVTLTRERRLGADRDPPREDIPRDPPTEL